MWKVNHDDMAGDITIHYDVYLDTKPNPENIVSSGQMDNSYRPVDPLVNGQTYYWKVYPYLNNVKGTCLSGVWRFTVDLDFNYEINLVSEYAQLSLKENDFKSFELHISNKGTQPDTIKLTAESEFLEDINFNTTEVLLPRNDKGFASLSIYIPEGTEPGTYTITIKAVSEGARIQGQEISDETVVIVRVLDTQTDVWDEDIIRLFSILIILIIILNIALAFSFILVRRNRKDKDKFRTMYYIQKYSRNKRLRNRTENNQLEIKRTLPVEEAERAMTQKLIEESREKEFDYTIPERMAILKYLKNTGKITERQYTRGLVSIRSWATVSVDRTGKNQVDPTVEVTVRSVKKRDQ
jgi:hypothetical protein